MNFSDFRRRCKLYQDGNDESVKTFRELSTKVSTIVVNETENRLLKSGKDTLKFISSRQYILLVHRSISYLSIAVYLTLPMQYILLSQGSISAQKEGCLYQLTLIKSGMHRYWYIPLVCTKYAMKKGGIPYPTGLNEFFALLQIEQGQKGEYQGAYTEE